MRPIPILITVILLLATSCSPREIGHKTIAAKGQDVTGTIGANNITEIDASQGIVVNYEVGSPVSVSYSVPESLSKYLIVKCRDGVLTCRFKDGISINLNGRHVLVNVTAPSVSEFEATSSAKINVTGHLIVKKLEIEASSAGSVQIASVNATTAEIDSNSAGAVFIPGLTADYIEIDTSSSGSVSLTGTMGKVNLDASSAGEVKLGGTCSILNAEASSGATVDGTRAKILTGSLDASTGASITVSEATQTPYKSAKTSGGSINIK